MSKTKRDIKTRGVEEGLCTHESTGKQITLNDAPSFKQQFYQHVPFEAARSSPSPKNSFIEGGRFCGRGGLGKLIGKDGILLNEIENMKPFEQCEVFSLRCRKSGPVLWTARAPGVYSSKSWQFLRKAAVAAIASKSSIVPLLLTFAI